MTFGVETPDVTDGDTTIRPANASEIGWAAPAATAPAGGGGDSLLDQLLGMANDVVTNLQKFPVTQRPGGWVLEFDAVIAEHEIKRYRKASIGNKKRAEDADMSVGNAMVLIEKNTGIYKRVDGALKQVNTGNGEPLLLGSNEFLNAFGKGANAHVAVRKFLGDAETNTIGQAVLKEAGWGEDLEPLDPTEA